MADKQRDRKKIRQDDQKMIQQKRTSNLNQSDERNKKDDNNC